MEAERFGAGSDIEPVKVELSSAYESGGSKAGHLAVLPAQRNSGTSSVSRPMQSEAMRTEGGGLTEGSEGGAQSNLSCRLVCLRILARSFYPRLQHRTLNSGRCSTLPNHFNWLPLFSEFNLTFFSTTAPTTWPPVPLSRGSPSTINQPSLSQTPGWYLPWLRDTTSRSPLSKIFSLI